MVEGEGDKIGKSCKDGWGVWGSSWFVVGVLLFIDVFTTGGFLWGLLKGCGEEESCILVGLVRGLKRKTLF